MEYIKETKNFYLLDEKTYGANDFDITVRRVQYKQRGKEVSSLDKRYLIYLNPRTLREFQTRASITVWLVYNKDTKKFSVPSNYIHNLINKKYDMMAPCHSLSAELKDKDGISEAFNSNDIDKVAYWFISNANFKNFKEYFDSIFIPSKADMEYDEEMFKEEK